jgi:cell wall-associated NlpC family hydrolase
MPVTHAVTLPSAGLSTGLSTGPASRTTRGVRRAALVLVAALAAVALSVSPAQPAHAAAKRQHKIHNAVVVAKHQQGDRYRYGANGPRRFDCSGLVQFSYRHAGITVPRTSDAQARYARRIKRKRLQRGDLMFFHRRGNVYHVGIFTGRTRIGRAVMVHAPGTGRRVQTSMPWTSHWFAATMRRR